LVFAAQCAKSDQGHSDKENAQMDKPWKVVGWDTFAREEYSVAAHATEEEAVLAAKAHYADIQREQPVEQSGGQTGIQDQVYIVDPAGRRRQYP
jgi:hypothetical protein